MNTSIGIRPQCWSRWDCLTGAACRLSEPSRPKRCSRRARCLPTPCLGQFGAIQTDQRASNTQGVGRRPSDVDALFEREEGAETTVTAAVPPPPPIDAGLEALLRRMRLPHMRRVAPEVLATAKAQRWDP